MNEYTIKLDTNEYEVEIEGRIEVDHNYGADADGNRASTVYFPEISSFEAFTYDQDGNRIEVKDPDILEKLENKAIDLLMEDTI